MVEYDLEKEENLRLNALHRARYEALHAKGLGLGYLEQECVEFRLYEQLADVPMQTLRTVAFIVALHQCAICLHRERSVILSDACSAS